MTRCWRIKHYALSTFSCINHIDLVRHSKAMTITTVFANPLFRCICCSCKMKGHFLRFNRLAEECFYFPRSSGDLFLLFWSGVPNSCLQRISPILIGKIFFSDGMSRRRWKWFICSGEAKEKILQKRKWVFLLFHRAVCMDELASLLVRSLMPKHRSFTQTCILLGIVDSCSYVSGRKPAVLFAYVDDLFDRNVRCIRIVHYCFEEQTDHSWFETEVNGKNMEIRSGYTDVHFNFSTCCEFCAQFAGNLSVWRLNDVTDELISTYKLFVDGLNICRNPWFSPLCYISIMFLRLSLLFSCSLLLIYFNRFDSFEYKIIPRSSSSSQVVLAGLNVLHETGKEVELTKRLTCKCKSIKWRTRRSHNTLRTSFCQSG